MWEWVVSVGAVVILSVMINILTPDGRLSGIIAVILSISIVFVIIKPINGIDLSNDFEFSFNEKEIVVDYEYAKYLNGLRCENVINQCKKALIKQGYSVVNVEIIYDEEDFSQLSIKNVKVILSNEVINSGTEHIDIIDKVKTLLSSLLAVNKGVIDVCVG